MRFATLAATEDNGRVSVARLAPVIETTFRAAYMLMSKLNEDMLEAGEEKKLDTLVVEGRGRAGGAAGRGFELRGVA